ncbi:MAG: SpoIIE family protein phosphatase [Termitinemataceae bacterium]|nr:MAG: SpoIIE family protein phosphatase [Termitinemataceae bacterium]
MPRFRCCVTVILFLLNLSLFAQQRYYWDESVTLSKGLASFPQSAQGESFSVIGYQESEKTGANTGSIYISIAVSKAYSDQNAASWSALDMWESHHRIAGPYTYATREPSIFNISIDKKNRIIISVASAPDKIDILISSDRGRNFTRTTVTNRNVNIGNELQNSNSETSDADILSPKIFCMADGSYVMFVVRNVSGALTLFYSHSTDGITWGSFISFVNTGGLTMNFLPYHVSINNIEYVVFQSFIAGSINRPSYQLYLKVSKDGGRTWTSAQRITRWLESYSDQRMVADSFNNERVHLSPDIVDGKETGNIFMVWERRYGAGIPSVYGAVIDPSGEMIGELMRINSSTGSCNNPISFMYKNERIVIWFDNRRQRDESYMAQSHIEDGEWQPWTNSALSASSEASIFTRALVVQNNMFIFWQEVETENSKIILLASDITAPRPSLRGANFKDNTKVSAANAIIKWDIPKDSSGIQGYSWVWSQNKNDLPPKIVSAAAATVETSEAATTDGQWYFTMIVCDNAGNWSSPATITFVRDITPPEPPLIMVLGEDEKGFILSNTFTIRWREGTSPDLGGYAWSLDFLDELSASEDLIKTKLAGIENRYINTSKIPFAIRTNGGKDVTSASYINRDDGWWCFTVFAIDDVGNVSPKSTYTFKLNKYQPHTYITFLDASQDVQGNLKMVIVGRGFSQNGEIQKIYFRKSVNDNIRTLYLENNDYIVRSDREVLVPNVENLPSGSYYIFVDHPLRGLAAAAEPILVGRSLTVKFGDYTKLYDPKWRTSIKRFFSLNGMSLIVLSLMVFCICAVFFSIRGLSTIWSDSQRLQIEILALLDGSLMPNERKQLKKVIRRRGIGLRVKIVAFTLVLVLFVIGMVSVPLYMQMNRTQRETLLSGLWNRSAVLLDGITASARVYMPSNSILELGYLPRQSASIPEAHYITITGYGSGVTATDDFVWASNDDLIREKINTPNLQFGVSRLNDPVNDLLLPLEEKWNNIAKESVGDMAQSIADLNREGTALGLQEDRKSQERLADIQTTVSALEERISNVLTELGDNIGSYPEFDFKDYELTGNTTYILYKPILFMQGTSDVFVRGTVRLEISTDSIIEAMAEGRRQIFRIIMFIALLALLIGGVGSMLLATVIILPIGRLVSYVEKVRDTENKAELDGDDVEIKSKDEIALLGTTINDMVHGLVKAAKAAEDLSLGKEIQKKFIPLELDSGGNKLSSGFKDTKNLQFFGYYEGAKGVSGDYFDYRDIDGRYYAIIKCDVAGKGIPAALIMIQVATMFINYFKDWKPQKNGIKFEKLVYQINDFIEELGFKGRFAAFTLCIMDSLTGEVTFCNAGDNIIHWFDHSSLVMKMLTLPETPATGVLPNIIVDSKGGYTTHKITIDHGDILLLYTDGIEEAKHVFRDDNFDVITCQEGGAPNDTPHDTHVVGQDGEEMGAPRVEAIINAVMNGEKYTLSRYHTPQDQAVYHFDFTDAESDVDNLILAMVSVEKIFRSYKPPDAGSESRILMDSKIDEFLKKYFVEYDQFFTDTFVDKQNPAYVYHTGIKEDEQYDDLTILGVCRK